MKRTHTCGELNEGNIGKKVTLCGWVSSIRSHGKITFIDLRDRYGITQIVTKESLDIKPEYVLKVQGLVKSRPPATINKKIPTGGIEIESSSIEIINPCKNLPIEIDDKKSFSDEIRLKYRYLDLRRSNMQNNIITRHKVTQATREFLNNQNFLEIETPLLVKPTPEGARDYLVPSRVNPGKFYSLPQSPQLYKQISMISGFDRYYQIARCLRDEDLRQDRQPEFTQIDIEMSFIDEDDIYNLIEDMLKHIFKKVLNIDIKTPFLRIKYSEAMKKYNSDKPDLRKDKNNPKEFAFCWVVDFPLFEYSKEEKRLVSMHHPFTSPKDEDINLLDKKPEQVRAKAYDVVLNGTELGGGSIRIHKQDIQSKIFNILKIDKKTAERRFGFLLEALSYGSPIHGGIALGLDRLVALITGTNDIREVIAFPKNKAAQCPMDGSPSEASDAQLKELNIKLDLRKK
jgi:aspartyl-tRNA synthetase